MATSRPSAESPWRRIFEDVRGELNNRRDASGIVGSINWLRKQMELRGANPNVVRNIIYRDKGKLADKRVLFTLLGELWESTGQPPLRAPELEVLLSQNSEGENEVVQLLGREKRRAYQGFVGAVRAGEHPKLLITGKPGSGKTLLTDYIQQALELPPPLAAEVVRQEFAGQDLAAALAQLALKLGVAAEVFEAKLIKVGVSGAYSVQADAQADVARVILGQLRQDRPRVLLLHISQSSPGQDVLASAPLRLSTPDVPRVGLTEWLWHNLIEPLGKLPQVSVLLSMAELPLALAERSSAYSGPLKLSPPSANEARRFVRARTQHLSAEQQEVLVQRSKRSFEDLRTLTLLAEAREPLSDSSKHIEQLGQLVLSSGDPQLKAFLEALAVLSLTDFPTFTQSALAALQENDAQSGPPSNLEAAFLDSVPGDPESWRPFSRQLSRTLRSKLREANPARFRALSDAASRVYQDAAWAGDSDAAGRYVHHLFAARAWDDLIAWAQQRAVPQSLLQRLWGAAQSELTEQSRTFEAVALQVAAYYARLGSTEHPDALQAFALLAASDDPKLRAWTLLKQAEGAVLHGHFGAAETLLRSWHEVGDPVLNIEAALIRANLARWYSRLGEAAALIGSATAALADLPDAPRSLAVRVTLWAGLIAKDQGDLPDALTHFRATPDGDDLLRARLGFQQGDVLLGLGRLAEAQTALSAAVEHAYRGEAPRFERARYLARRGTLLRRQGALGASSADFAAAQAVLAQAEAGHAAVRLEFERAKLDDEAALTLLAEGQGTAAILQLHANYETFRAYGQRTGVDPTFRMLRTTLRLAVAYGCRALGQPLLLPPGPYPETAAHHPDLQQARRLLTDLLGVLGGSAERYQALTARTHLWASSLLPPDEAVTQARRALELARYPYGQGQARVYLAAALLRSAHLAEARDHLQQARTDLTSSSDDYALKTALVALEADMLLRAGATADAHAHVSGVLREALRETSSEVSQQDAPGHSPQALAPYAEQLLRRFGEAAERLGTVPDCAALGLGDAPLTPTLRPADALALRWQQVQRHAQMPEADGWTTSGRQCTAPQATDLRDPNP